jgi:hypothetical protein
MLWPGEAAGLSSEIFLNNLLSTMLQTPRTLSQFYLHIQQCCYDFPINLTPWRYSNPGLVGNPMADTMSAAPRNVMTL